MSRSKIEEKLLTILLNGMLECSTSGLSIGDDKIQSLLIAYPNDNINEFDDVSKPVDSWTPQIMQKFDSLIKMIDHQIHFKKELESIHKSCADFCRISLNNNEKTISEVLSVIPNTQIPSNNSDLKIDKNKSNKMSNNNNININNNHFHNNNLLINNNHSLTPNVNFNGFLNSNNNININNNNNNGILNSNLLNYPHQNGNSISPIHNTRSLAQNLSDQNNNLDNSIFSNQPFRPLSLNNNNNNNTPSNNDFRSRSFPGASDPFPILQKNQNFFAFNSPMKSYNNSSSSYSQLSSPLQSSSSSSSIFPQSSNYYHKLTSEKNSPKKGENISKRIRKKGNTFPKEAISILKKWLMENLDNPYPCEQSKQELASETGLNKFQISNWFINARRRYIKNLRLKNDHERKPYNQRIKYQKIPMGNSNDYLSDNLNPLIVEEVLESSGSDSLKKSLDFSNSSSPSSSNPSSPSSPSSLSHIPPPDIRDLNCGDDKNDLTMDHDTKEIKSLPPSLVFSENSILHLSQKNYS